MNRKQLICNIIFIILVGTLSHFTYEWSNKNQIVGLFTAVNESTWEHIKLLIFPTLLLMIFEYPSLGKNKNYFIGYFKALAIGMLLIPILFYGYKLIFKDNILLLDVIIFDVSVIIGQIILYKTINEKEYGNLYKAVSIIGILLILIMYFTFSFYPPKTFLFEDPVTSEYGIVDN